MSTSEIEGRHLHIHLGAIDPGVTDIHIHVGAPSGEVASEVTEEPTVEPTVAASLARLKAWDARNAKWSRISRRGRLTKTRARNSRSCRT